MTENEKMRYHMRDILYCEISGYMRKKIALIVLEGSEKPYLMSTNRINSLVKRNKIKEAVKDE